MRVRRALTALATLALLGALVVGWGVAAYRFILHPAVERPLPTDVSYVLASPGGSQWVERGLVDALPGRAVVVSVTPAHLAMPSYQRLCAGGGPREVLCVSPDPVSTQGEARRFAELARQRGWRSVTVVTHRSHVSRSRELVRRCFGGDVRMRVSPAETRRDLAVALFYETGAGLKAALSPSC